MNQTPNIPVIAVDGPSGVGKGTLAQLLCQKTGFHMLDSGAIYRALAYAVSETNTPLEATESLVALAHALPVRFEKGAVYYQNTEITQTIRTEAIASIASQVAAMGPVRQALLQRQKDFAQPPGLVADGRDMGTVVFPDAKVKLFLTASAQTRAKRRANQLKNQGVDAKIEKITLDIEQRDARDRQRQSSPLVAAEEALQIDTTALDIEQVFAKAWTYCQRQGVVATSDTAF